jgi:hypothetical protein
LADDVQGWKAICAEPFQALGVDTTDPAPQFTAHGGLGFYVDDCTASFRNVTIERVDAHE